MPWETIIYKRSDLYRQVWEQPVLKVAKTYGISDVALAKICRKLNVPLPGRGYWARKAAGQQIEPAPAAVSRRHACCSSDHHPWGSGRRSLNGPTGGHGIEYLKGPRGQWENQGPLALRFLARDDPDLSVPVDFHLLHPHHFGLVARSREEEHHPPRGSDPRFVLDGREDLPNLLMAQHSISRRFAEEGLRQLIERARWDYQLCAAETPVPDEVHVLTAPVRHVRSALGDDSVPPTLDLRTSIAERRCCAHSGRRSTSTMRRSSFWVLTARVAKCRLPRNRAASSPNVGAVRWTAISRAGSARSGPLILPKASAALSRARERETQG